MKLLKLVLLFFFLLSGETIIISTGEWAPYTSLNEPEYGVASAITSAAFKATSIEVKYKFLPWKRCEKYLQQGKVDAIMPYARNSQREFFYFFSDSILVTKTLWFYLKNNKKVPDSYSSFRELKYLKIGGCLGYSTNRILEANNLTDNLELVSNEEQNLRKLINKRVDVIYLDELVGEKLINDKFPSVIGKITTMETPVEVSGVHLLTSKKNKQGKEIIEKFNKGLEKIREDGTYHELLKKFKINNP